MGRVNGDGKTNITVTLRWCFPEWERQHVMHHSKENTEGGVHGVHGGKLIERHCAISEDEEVNSYYRARYYDASETVAALHIRSAELCSARTGLETRSHILKCCESRSRGRLRAHRQECLCYMPVLHARATSPLVIRDAVAADRFRAGVDIGDAGLVLVDGNQHIFLHGLPCIARVSDRVDGNLFQVSGIDEVL